MTDICLLVYFLPHVSLCVVLYVIWSNISLLQTTTPEFLKSWYSFTIGTLRSTNVNDVANV